MTKPWLLLIQGVFDSSDKRELLGRVKKQVEMAIEEADLVILLF